MKIYLEKNVALGNGTRPKGFFLGESSAKTVEEINHANTALADGVSPVELTTVLNNPDLVSHVAPLAAVPPLVDPVYDPPRPTADPVLDDPFAEPSVPAEPESGSDAKPQPDSSDIVPDAVRSQPVSALKPPKPVAKLLADSNLKTVGEVLDYADSHEGLVSLGLTAEQEEEIVSAIDELLK